ncbi:MAG: ABC transporter permease [Chloroflexales bacterium]|nr:ABC transporter permease [Chloroflexales bacterium]
MSLPSLPTMSPLASALPLVRALAGRLLQAVLTLLGISVIIWVLLPLAPGDPAQRLLQARGVQDPTPQQVAALRAELALDRPLPLQYAEWLSRAVRGDLSLSYQTGRPVLEELGKRLPATLLLAGTALLLALLIALIGGLLSAAYHERWPDQAIRLFTQVGVSLPAFLAGLLALRFIVVEMDIGKVLSGGQWQYVLLPALCLAISRAADWTQLLRASLLEALGANYTLVASARGATRLRVLWRYALPNAALPFLTVIGVGIGGLIGGSAIIEAIFTWPGIGSYVFAAISARDFPVVQGFVLLAGLSYVAASLLVDLVALLVDPRLRDGGRP